MDCHALLQGIFPTQESNPSLPNGRQIFYHLSHQGSPRMLEWVTYTFSRVSSWPRNQSRVSGTAGRFFTSWATREAQRGLWWPNNNLLLKIQEPALSPSHSSGLPKFGPLLFFNFEFPPFHRFSILPLWNGNPLHSLYYASAILHPMLLSLPSINHIHRPCWPPVGLWISEYGHILQSLALEGRTSLSQLLQWPLSLQASSPVALKQSW